MKEKKEKEQKRGGVSSEQDRMVILFKLISMGFQ